MSVWTDRDFVVLRWLHQHPPYAEILRTNWMSRERHLDLPELTEQDVHLAVETLHDDGLVDYRDQTWDSAGGVHWTAFQVSGAGLQALGEWPVFDVLTSPAELGQLLEALAELAANGEEETNLRTAARSARAKTTEALQSLAAGALGAVVRSQL
jgi:hypothetical protein